MRCKKAIRNTEAAHLQKDIDHTAESLTFLDIIDKDSTNFKFDHDAIRADFFKIYTIINKFSFNNSLPRFLKMFVSYFKYFPRPALVGITPNVPYMLYLKSHLIWQLMWRVIKLEIFCTC